MAELRFRNIDYTDRELLTVIQKAGGDSGVTTEEIAIQLGITANGKKHRTPSLVIGPRLSWMKRYGFLEATEDNDGRNIWVLTKAGKALIGGNLTKAVQTALEKMDPGSQLLLMRALSRKGFVQASNEVATAIRREWLHQVAQR